MAPFLIIFSAPTITAQIQAKKATRKPVSGYIVSCTSGGGALRKSKISYTFRHRGVSCGSAKLPRSPPGIVMSRWRLTWVWKKRTLDYGLRMAKLDTVIKYSPAYECIIIYENGTRVKGR